VVAAHRAWVQRFLEQLAAADGLADPSVAAEQLHLLVEGAIVRAVSGQRETAAASARAVAAVLLAQVVGRVSALRRAGRRPPTGSGSRCPLRVCRTGIWAG
jgi:hypothetical protein